MTDYEIFLYDILSEVFALNMCELNNHLTREKVKQFVCDNLPKDRFVVICDERNNPPEVIEANDLIVEVNNHLTREKVKQFVCDNLPKDRFVVICDERNNPLEVIEANDLIVEVIDTETHMWYRLSYF